MYMGLGMQVMYMALGMQVNAKKILKTKNLGNFLW